MLFQIQRVFYGLQIQVLCLRYCQIIILWHGILWSIFITHVFPRIISNDVRFVSFKSLPGKRWLKSRNHSCLIRHRVPPECWLVAIIVDLVKQIVVQSNLNQVGFETVIKNGFRQFQPKFKNERIRHWFGQKRLERIEIKNNLREICVSNCSKRVPNNS